MSRPDTDYPHPDDPGQTHCDECWQWPRHHNCAVAKVDRLEGRTAGGLELLDEATDWLPV